MIMVDSSVWIDYFNGTDSRETSFLDTILGSDSLCLGDIILAEVLQGFRTDREYTIAIDLLSSLPIFPMMNTELAVKSAENFRSLRKRGVTVRKSVDVWIATFCIESSIPLLFRDRDFLPFVQHLSLESALAS